MTDTRLYTRLILACALVATSGFAARAAESKPLDYTLAKDAISLSSQTDAYNMHCKKETKLAKNFIKKFTEKGLAKDKVEELETIHKKAYGLTEEKLKKENPDCKNVDFLLAQLEVMRALKETSYRLNGIDPATVPNQLDSIPDIDLLLPKDKQGERVDPSGNPPQ